MRISHFFIDRPIFAAVVSIVFVIVGLVSFGRLPVAQYPEIAPPTVNVTGQYPGASADVVDPYRQRAESRSVNFRGGDPTRRDYGLELDASILAHGEIAPGIELQGGIEGGVLFPGHAFDNENGDTMTEVGMGRLRLGITF